MTPSTLKPSLAQLAALAAFSLLFAPALSAQNSGRGFLKAQAGSTFLDGESNLTAGGGFGVRITGFLDLFAEAGTIRNTCDFGLLGSRVTMPIRSVLTPFFEIGGGAGRLDPHLRSRPPVLQTAPKIESLPAPPERTNLMLTATAGVHLAATRRFGFDFAWRYLRISTDRPAFSTSLLYSGIVYRF